MKNSSVKIIDVVNAQCFGDTQARGRVSDWRSRQDAILDENPFPDGARSGVLVPWREARGLSVTGGSPAVDNAGGMTVGSEVPEIGLALRDAMVLPALGARFLTGLRANANLSRGKVGVQVGWKTETAPAGDGSFLFGNLHLAPKRITAYVDVSDQLLFQSPAFEGVLRADLVAAIGEAAQAAVIAGTGADGEPLGILNHPDVPRIADAYGNGSTCRYYDVVDLEHSVALAKGDHRTVGWVLSPGLRRALRRIGINAVDLGGVETAITIPVYPPYPATADQGFGPNTLLGYPAGVTTAVPTDLVAGSTTGCTALLCGKFSELFMGFWGPGIMIEAHRIVSGDDAMKGFTRIMASCYFDGGIRTPEAFAAKADCLLEA